ncbi:MAG: hypothetical protein V4710_01320 [Verrucomicrobiota bacterium]
MTSLELVCLMAFFTPVVVVIKELSHATWLPWLCGLAIGGVCGGISVIGLKLIDRVAEDRMKLAKPPSTAIKTIAGNMLFLAMIVWIGCSSLVMTSIVKFVFP